MKFKLKISNLKNSGGMTLFIAVVVMGILLFISFAVVGITLKGTLFATSGRDSQHAFYAADAGTECAFYWDSKFDSFSTTSVGVPRSINCAGSLMMTNMVITGTTTASGGSIATRIGGGGDASPTSIFGFVMNQGLESVPYCAIVTVTKKYDGNNLKTYIESRGYNTCDTSNPRRVERGIEVTY